MVGGAERRSAELCPDCGARAVVGEACAVCLADVGDRRDDGPLVDTFWLLDLEMSASQVSELRSAQVDPAASAHA